MCCVYNGQQRQTFWPSIFSSMAARLGDGKYIFRERWGGSDVVPLS